MSYHISVHRHGKCLVETPCGSAYCSILARIWNKISDYSGQMNSLSYKELQERRVELLEFIKILVCKGKYGLRSIIGKIIVTKMICKHPELSDEKVKNITNMML